MDIVIRPIANREEIYDVFRVEVQSYPPNVAATLEAFIQRHEKFPHFFYVAEYEKQLIGVINGVRTEQEDLTDETLKMVSNETVTGPYFCILTVAVDSTFRGRGIGQKLVKALIKQAEQLHISAILLMCEKSLIPFYSKLGFVYKQPSSSNHGNINWHEMKLKL